MEPLDLNLWQQVLAQIQRELPSQAYETWFQPTRALESTGSLLVVEVPNPFFRDWLASHYIELIHRILERLTQAKIQVEFRVASRPKPPHAEASQGPQGGSGPSLEPTPIPSLETRHAGFNPRYTFEQFVVGPSNRFAYAASVAVSETPAKTYNPLFICGGVGLGKTHLMQAIGHGLKERFPQMRVVYVSSEKFTNQLISAIQNRTMASFRERYRNCDALLVDDIHFIGGKESTQEVFFHTFNALYDANRQIVISSDRPPKELRGVEERLVSRFEWGLVTDVQPPDLETRVAILRKKAHVQGVPVPDEVTLFIAERINSNIRELEGALNRVIACSVLVSREISLGMAQEVLRGLVAETARRITLDRIQQVVAEYFRLSVADLRSKRRSRDISMARQVAMALARKLTDASLPLIGEAFGGRDHATVIYACQKMDQAKRKAGGVEEMFKELEGRLG